MFVWVHHVFPSCCSLLVHVTRSHHARRWSLRTNSRRIRPTVGPDIHLELQDSEDAPDARLGARGLPQLAAASPTHDAATPRPTHDPSTPRPSHDPFTPRGPTHDPSTSRTLLMTRPHHVPYSRPVHTAHSTHDPSTPRGLHMTRPHLTLRMTRPHLALYS